MIVFLTLQKLSDRHSIVSIIFATISVKFCSWLMEIFSSTSRGVFTFLCLLYTHTTVTSLCSVPDYNTLTVLCSNVHMSHLHDSVNILTVSIQGPEAVYGALFDRFSLKRAFSNTFLFLSTWTQEYSIFSNKEC